MWGSMSLDLQLCRLDSVVTYTSISFDSDGPSWGILLRNVDEFSEMDPCKEVAQQGHVPPLSPAYVPDPIELEHLEVSMIFVDTVEAGQGLIRSPGHDVWTIARAADRAKDRTAYETELQEVRQAYLSSEARNKALLARLETLETHMSRIEWQRQSAEDLAVTQMMRIHALEARAQTDMVEDADSSCHDAAYPMTWGNLKKKLTDKYYPKGKIKKLKIQLWNLRVKGNDVAAYTQRFQELALMCTKFLADEIEKVDKYISGLPDNIHGNVMSARPKTLDETIELANDLMDQKLRTYAERQNDNKRKADDSSRNIQQQQPHKKQNVARAYTVGPGKKKAYTENLPLCTKCNYHHTGQCAPKCGN
nr:reverse transcriptase domain-containing protein [Tanacetum cinerariifolium]